MSDNVKYRAEQVLISDTEVVIAGHTYAPDQITAVSVERLPLSGAQRVGYALVAFLLMSIGFALADVLPCMLWLGILGLIGIPAVFFTKQSALKITTSAGEEVVLTLANPKSVLDAEGALRAHVVKSTVDNRTSMITQSNAAQGDVIAPSSSLAPNSESSSIAEENGPETDAGERLGAYVAELPDVSDERVNRLLNGLQDRMAYKREAVLNEIGREKLTDPRIVGAVEILAVSDRVDTIRDIAQRVLDSLDLEELRNDMGREPAAMPAAIPSPPAASTNLSGARSHRATPRLLILLVDKMPPGGPEAHIRRLLNDLPAQEIPEDVILRVTDSYADQGYIAANTMFTPVQQGIRADDNKTWYRSYSTADGIRGTQVFIYE